MIKLKYVKNDYSYTHLSTSYYIIPNNDYYIIPNNDYEKWRHNQSFP